MSECSRRIVQTLCSTPICPHRAVIFREMELNKGAKRRQEIKRKEAALTKNVRRTKKYEQVIRREIVSRQEEQIRSEGAKG